MTTTPEDRTSLSGVELIAAERVRQLEDLGYTPEHDAEHHEHDLAFAAACYAAPIPIYIIRVHQETAWTSKDGKAHGDVSWVEPWPGWKRRERVVEDGSIPLQDRIDELTKAGALIAAEIDRLQAEGNE